MSPAKDEVRSASARIFPALNRMANGDDALIPGNEPPPAVHAQNLP